MPSAKLMRIVSFSAEPILEIPFLNAGRGPGGFSVDLLPIHLAVASGLPENLEAVMATADLQGRERFEDSAGRPPRLLGEVLPRRLSQEILPELGLNPQRMGIILAGDFYTVPALDRLGGTGDVSEVWEEFSLEFAWVAGVAGNHDMFGESFHPVRPISQNAYYLDNQRIGVEGLKIAGLGGILGNPRRPHRRSAEQFVECLSQLLDEPVDLVIMHDGPNAPELQQRGSPEIREALQRLRPPLVVRGHAHWEHPLVAITPQTQVLNVDCRVVILCPEGSPLSAAQSTPSADQ